jgi:hypothetical protein
VPDKHKEKNMLKVANGTTVLDSQMLTPVSNVVGTPFREVLASVKTDAAANAVDVSALSSQAAAVAALSTALSQAGISVPPALRITSGPNGLELSGDKRNDKFQAMLQANPALQSQLSGMISQADMSRKAALNAVANDFAGKNPGAGATAFLEDFMDDEKNDTYSISFNGANVSVDEMGKKAWEPVKDKADFTKDLLAAYTGYLLTHQATVEKDKNDKESDADLDFRAKLAKAAQDSATTV